jgi:hypothetical protein
VRSRTDEVLRGDADGEDAQRHRRLPRDHDGGVVVVAGEVAEQHGGHQLGPPLQQAGIARHVPACRQAVAAEDQGVGGGPAPVRVPDLAHLVADDALGGQQVAAPESPYTTAAMLPTPANTSRPAPGSMATTAITAPRVAFRATWQRATMSDGASASRAAWNTANAAAAADAASGPWPRPSTTHMRCQLPLRAVAQASPHSDSPRMGAQRAPMSSACGAGRGARRSRATRLKKADPWPGRV